jgi:hypothetical protein
MLSQGITHMHVVDEFVIQLFIAPAKPGLHELQPNQYID